MKTYKDHFEILGSERLRCSICGNPKKRLILQHVKSGDVLIAETATNAGCGYLSYPAGAEYIFEYHITPARGRMIIDTVAEVK